MKIGSIYKISSIGIHNIAFKDTVTLFETSEAVFKDNMPIMSINDLLMLVQVVENPVTTSYKILVGSTMGWIVLSHRSDQWDRYFDEVTSLKTIE